MTIRVLDFGKVESLRSLAIFHGVAYALGADDPDVITLTRPLDPFVSIGHHQDAKTEVELEYCAEAGIPVYRREVGGGAVYLDEGQTFWHTIFHQSRVPTTLADVYTKFLAGPVLALNRYGIPAVHRPVNDIQVEGRKIGGTGAATIGESLVVAGSLMFDFNYELMSKVLRVPSEKFRDKVYQTMREYLTTINRELGDDAPDRGDAERILIECFVETLGQEIVRDDPRVDELESIDRLEEKIASEEWLLLEGLPPSGDKVKIAEGVNVVEGVYKAPGGLIRATSSVRDGVIEGIVLSGDFFFEPAEARQSLQDTLVGVNHDEDSVLSVVKRELSDVDAPGVDASDVTAAVMAVPQQPMG